MSSAIYFNLDQSKILLSGNGMMSVYVFNYYIVNFLPMNKIYKPYRSKCPNFDRLTLKSYNKRYFL